MANYKRKKSRRQVRCTLCTDARGGNSKKMGGRSPAANLSMATKSQRKKIAEQDGGWEDFQTEA
jgi:hypothetical protein